MYYNKITKTFTLDILDYFILSAFLGSLLASYVKKIKHFSSDEKNEPTSDQSKIEKIANFNRGGQLEIIPINKKRFMMAQRIKNVIERLASFIRQRELKNGFGKLFFTAFRLVLEMVLSRSQIAINYVLLSEGVNAPVTILTCTLGGVAGFTASWFIAGITILTPSVLMSILLLKSFYQQIINIRNYLLVRKIVMENAELKQNIGTFFMKGEDAKNTILEMKRIELDKDRLPEFDFDSDQTFEQLIKSKMKDELGLIENPTQKQLKKIIHNKKRRKKSKTVYFKDFIKKTTESSDENDILEAEIVKKIIKIKTENEQL